MYFTEPGYYQDDFGIRIEDIVLIKDSITDHKMAQRPFLEFETVTMCPIQTKMLAVELLTNKEVRRLMLKYLFMTIHLIMFENTLD